MFMCLQFVPFPLISLASMASKDELENRVEAKNHVILEEAPIILPNNLESNLEVLLVEQI